MMKLITFTQECKRTIWTSPFAQTSHVKKMENGKCYDQFFVLNEPVDDIENFRDVEYESSSGVTKKVLYTDEKNQTFLRRKKEYFKKEYFLFECDNNTLAEQLLVIEDIKPYIWSCTHSGGKSFHCIIRTNYDGTDDDEYQYIWERLADFLFRGNGLSPDTSCKDSMKFTRLPYGIRRDKETKEFLRKDDGTRVIQAVLYHNTQVVVDVSPFTRMYQNVVKKIKEKEKFEQQRKKLATIPNKGVYKGTSDYHNLPSFKKANRWLGDGERYEPTRNMLYAMSQNGYDVVDMLNALNEVSSVNGLSDYNYARLTYEYNLK